MTRPRLSRRKRVIFALCALVLATLLSLGGLVALDVFIHLRPRTSAGVNIWGYRGPVVGRKRAGELRIAFLGGSTAFGYGVTAAEAIPARLEEQLRARRDAPGQGPISVVNLAYNNEGAYSFAFTLRDYAYLDYDLVCLYQGYNDLGGRRNTQVFRHESPVFRLTGYLPVFPLAFKEKAASMLAGGDVAALYRKPGEAKTVFRPGVAARATAGALNAVASVGESLERQLQQVFADPRPAEDVAGAPCPSPWGAFCQSTFDAIDLALAEGKNVLVITQPYLTGISGERNRSQQMALRDALLRRYGGNPRVQRVDLGEAIDLNDARYSYDTMHLTPEGNQLIANRLVDPVLTLAAGNTETRKRQ